MSLSSEQCGSVRVVKTWWKGWWAHLLAIIDRFEERYCSKMPRTSIYRRTNITRELRIVCLGTAGPCHTTCLHSNKLFCCKKGQVFGAINYKLRDFQNKSEFIKKNTSFIGITICKPYVNISKTCYVLLDRTTIRC